MNYLLNVDCLEFRGSTEIHLKNLFSDSIYKLSEGLLLQRVKDYGNINTSYSYYFKILLNGDEIGSLYSKALDLSFSTGFNTMVKIENKVFYVYDLISILKMIVEALKMTTTMIKRLDLAYDTDVDVLSRFKTLYYDASTEFKLRKIIKVKGTGRDDDELTIGSLKSRSKCISIYNKTNEISQHSQKEYIRNIHRKKFGFKIIYRVELRLFNKLQDLKNLDLMNLGNTEYLESIYNTYLNTLIQFVDVKTENKIDFIILNNTGMTIQREKKKKVQFGGKQVKSIINFLDREYDSPEFAGVRKNLKIVRSVILKKYNIENWYLLKK